MRGSPFDLAILLPDKLQLSKDQGRDALDPGCISIEFLAEFIFLE